MSDRHDGDFKGVDISRLLEGFREKLEHSRRPYLLTDKDRSVVSDLKAFLRELENLTAAKQPSRQAILEQTWERIRHRIGAGGVVLNYTGVDDPYNIVNLAWAGSEGMLSADGRLKMLFGRDFIKGHLTFQGPEYDPMPALDIEQALNDSYFQTDVLDNAEINEMDDYLQLMQPYGIEDSARGIAVWGCRRAAGRRAGRAAGRHPLHPGRARSRVLPRGRLHLACRLYPPRTRRPCEGLRPRADQYGSMCASSPVIHPLHCRRANS